MLIKVDTPIPTRLDRYLKRIYPALTQGVIERLLRQGKIKVNNKKVVAGFRVSGGEELDVDIAYNPHPELDSGSHEILGTQVRHDIISLAKKILGSYLLYEDENIIAINKPAGLSTQGGSKITLSINDALSYLNRHPELVSGSHEMLNQVQHDGCLFRLVHRLDKETSGVLLIARNYASSVKLSEAFQAKIIQKTYIAMVLGAPQQEEGEISNIISKNRDGAYEIVQEDLKDGKLAVTRYKICKKFGKFSLIEFTPLTGRTHQLRFHAMKLGCPIIGDIKYGNETAKALSKNMLLHAHKIMLPASILGKEIMVEAELPRYFLEL